MYFRKTTKSNVAFSQSFSTILQSADLPAKILAIYLYACVIFSGIWLRMFLILIKQTLNKTMRIKMLNNRFFSVLIHFLNVQNIQGIFSSHILIFPLKQQKREVRHSSLCFSKIIQSDLKYFNNSFF